MTRTLPAQPNLEHLKHEAKAIHKHHKSGNPIACETLRYLSRFSQSSDEDILRSPVKLLDVQQALAREYGFENWKALKEHIDQNVPRFSNPRTALYIEDYDRAVEHYVDWLGITLDWEWREAEGQPVIMSMSRDGFSFFLSELGEYNRGTQIHLQVNNLEAYADELNARRPGSAEITLAPPYEFPNMSITDPFGNTLHFEGQNLAAEQKKRSSVRPKMRKFVQERLDAGKPFPTPEEVRNVVGPPLGTAIEVLNEFPGYREVFEERQSSAFDDRPARSSSHGLPSHLDLSVGDISASIRFYDTLLTGLGFQRYREKDDAWQEPGPTRAAWGRKYPNGVGFGIDLRPATSKVETAYDRFTPGPHHLALNADSDADIDRVHALMVEAGLTVLDAPTNYGGRPGYGKHYYAAFYADPDAFKVEVVNARGKSA